MFAALRKTQQSFAKLRLPAEPVLCYDEHSDQALATERAEGGKSLMSEEYSLPPYRSRFFHHMKGWERFERLGEHIYLPKNHYIV